MVEQKQSHRLWNWKPSHLDDGPVISRTLLLPKANIKQTNQKNIQQYHPNFEVFLQFLLIFLFHKWCVEMFVQAPTFHINGLLWTNGSTSNINLFSGDKFVGECGQLLIHLFLNKTWLKANLVSILAKVFVKISNLTHLTILGESQSAICGLLTAVDVHPCVESNYWLRLNYFILTLHHLRCDTTTTSQLPQCTVQKTR